MGRRFGMKQANDTKILSLRRGSNVGLFMSRANSPMQLSTWRDRRLNQLSSTNIIWVDPWIKVHLTPNFFFPLMKSTSFPYYFCEKIISIDKIPAILQFLAPRPSIAGSGSGFLWRHRRTLLKTLKRRLTGFRALWKHIWDICASYFIKNGQDC